MALIDLSKAFNRVDHCLVIEDLHDMKVPAWLLKILISYLTERSMVLKFSGAISTPRALPGSAPQGVFLGCFFFMVKFNGSLLRPSVPRPFQKPEPLMHSKATSCTVKYIDDASQACSVKLKKSPNKIDMLKAEGPWNFLNILATLWALITSYRKTWTIWRLLLMKISWSLIRRGRK